MPFFSFFYLGTEINLSPELFRLPEKLFEIQDSGAGDMGGRVPGWYIYIYDILFCFFKNAHIRFKIYITTQKHFFSSVFLF